MNDGIFTSESLGGRGKPFHDTGALPRLAGRQGLVGEPPEEQETDDDSHEAVEEEHPPETRETSDAVHELEAGRDEADDSGRDLSGGEVHADPFAGSRGRVEGCEVEGHAGPHSGDDGAEEESKEFCTPGFLDGGEARPDNTCCDDNPGHPRAGTDPGHDQVTWEIKNDIGDVEQRKCLGHIAWGHAEDRDEVVADVLVHGLRDTNVGTNGTTEKVKNPKS